MDAETAAGTAGAALLGKGFSKGSGSFKNSSSSGSMSLRLLLRGDAVRGAAVLAAWNLLDQCTCGSLAKNGFYTFCTCEKKPLDVRRSS